MDKFVIHGGHSLKGEITVAGAKNAALPLMAASLLTAAPFELSHVPQLHDVKTMANLLSGMGVAVQFNREGIVHLEARTIDKPFASYDMVKTMRAAILCLGPLLARCGEAKVSLPGGCAIGTRPVDQHLKGLEAMGATVTLEEGYIHAQAKRLHGARLTTDMVTVTGTENLMMAACLAEGESRIENAAREPEIINLAQGLIAMGAKINGAGTDTIDIQGVAKLSAARCRVMADRIEAGTYLCAAAATHGNIHLKGLPAGLLDSFVEKLRSSGCVITEDKDSLTLSANGSLKAVDISTAPYPGFPTDLQAQYMALNCVGQGVSVLKETIFENRFQHVLELARLGANIQIDGRTAVIHGGAPLHGTTVMATDLRASAGLVIAGLAAQGETHIERIYHLDRGYEHMEKKLSALGAVVVRQPS